MAKGIVNQSLKGVLTKGGGTSDHSRLYNRDTEEQHPIEAITGLREELDAKLNSETALPLIDEALKTKACGLYYDAKKELAKKPYWYICAEIDPVTKQGTKESIISGPYNLGAGGGGGGSGTGVTRMIINLVNWPAVVVSGSTVKLDINWSSTIGEENEPTGDGTLYLTVNGKQVAVKTNQSQGLTSLDISKYVVLGTNTVQIRILDAYGTSATKIGNFSAIALELTSNFNANLPFTNAINYTYTPWGDVEKEVHFIVDGQERDTQTVLSTGEQQTYRLTGLAHGSHQLEVYFTANINGYEVKSNTLYYDLIYYLSGNTTPIIVSTYRGREQEQYIPFNIPYRVYIYGKNSFNVQYLENGVVIKDLTVGSGEQIWEYKNERPGAYTLQIKCGSVLKTFNVHIFESNVKVLPVTSDLALGLSAQGRANNEPENERNTWKFGNIECEFENFNWRSNGWVKDSVGNTVLRLSGDARVRIPYKPFETDFKSRGKTIELEIATSAVMNYSSTIISCLDNSRSDFFEAKGSFANEESRDNVFDVSLDTDASGELKIKALGLTVGSHVITYTAAGWNLDGTIIDLATYGIVLTKRPLVPNETEDYILLGDNIVIDYSLSARGFYVTPQIAALRSQQSAISTQYKEDDHVRLAFVIEKNTDTRLVWMYINGIASGAVQYPSDDNFRQLEPNIIELGSNDAVLDVYNIRIYDNNLNSKQIVNNWIADTQDGSLKAERYYRNDNYNDKNELVIDKLPTGLPYMIWDIDPLPQYKGDKRLGNVKYVDNSNPSRSFESVGATYNVQGTSSAVYPVKNIRLKYKKNKDFPTEEFSWTNSEGEDIKKFAITEGGIGDNYFTHKVDYASSEGANNVELTKLYNDACKAAGILTPPQRQNGKVRVGIDGFPMIAFHQDADGNITFCTKANFNNDKANEDVYGFEDGDESWETTNNSAGEGKFLIPVTVDNFENAFEIRYPDEDGYNDMTHLGPMTAWVASTYRGAATGQPLPSPVTYTYSYVEAAEDGSFSQKTSDPITFGYDTAEYRLTKFKVELKDWFNVDSTLFYYIFTHLFLMIDSRAKNAFPTYFKSREEGDGGDRWFWLPYDMDTAIGINNEGKLVFDYSLEDIDQLNGSNVFNGQDSVMWNNVRDAFKGEIAQMYAKLRTQRLISYDNIEAMFEEHQGKWSENIFNEDSKVKYVAPLAQGDNYLEMLQGAKAEQRKWWLYNRFKYFDSKYNAGDAKADFVQFRAYVQAGTVKPSITVTPYADIYATVSYSNGAAGAVSKRAKRNEPITLQNPLGIEAGEIDQETYIYSASQLKSIGDLSPFRPDTVKVGNAVKLQSLKVGDGDPSYQNPNLKELTLGNNTLLKSIDARNCINWGRGDSAPQRSLDVSACINLEEIYLEGTQLLGVILPDGGNIKHLHLPETITKLTIKNQKLLTDLSLPDASHIDTLWLENIPATSINTSLLVHSIPTGSEVRLIGINETFASYAVVKELYDKLDTMTGLDSEGELVSKAQVTGTIHILNEISYAEWVTLTTMYPEVEIDATIICTVIFNYPYAEDESNRQKSFNVISGNGLNAPAIPTKPEDEQYYYTFNSWDKSFDNVTTDLNINPIFDSHIQTYTIIFDTRTTEIGVTPTSIDLTYGSRIVAPTIIPPEGWEDLHPGETFNPDEPIEGVEFIEWRDEDLNSISFSNLFVSGSLVKHPQMTITFTAHWRDSNLPEATVSRVAFNKFAYHAEDNMGISAWAVTNSQEIADDAADWHSISPVAILDGEYTIEAAGDYYFHVKDDGNDGIPNKAFAKITAYPISLVQNINNEYDNSTNIIILHLTENEIELSNFALSGTTVVVDASIDSHYKDLELSVAANSVDINDELLINAPLVINGAVQPREYTVQFDRFDRGFNISNQNVVYKHLVNLPTAQVFDGYALTNWHTDAELTSTPWDFKIDRVLGDMILYAKWEEITTPTQIEIKVAPEYDGSNPLALTLNYSQDTVNGAEVDWGDGSATERSSSTGTISLTHNFVYNANLVPENETDSVYTISIYRRSGTYLLGINASIPAIQPITVVSNIKFSWNVTETNPGAFKGATGLTKIYLTNFISKISSSMFEGCLNVTTFTVSSSVNGESVEIDTNSLPDSISNIESGAFRGCAGLTAIHLPLKLDNLGSFAFRDCTGLTSVIFTETCPLNTIQTQVFNGCTALRTVTFSKNITTIAEKCFQGCTALQSIVLPANIVALGDRIFAGCTSLSSVKILATEMTTFGSNVFNSCPQLTTAGALGSESDIEFNWTTKVPERAFSGMSSLTTIRLPNSITEIGANAFNQAMGLSIVSLSNNLTTIGDMAFFTCVSLLEIDLPASIRTMGYRVFESCLSLQVANIRFSSLDLASKELMGDPKMGWFAQTRPEILTLHIPEQIGVLNASNFYGAHWNCYSSSSVENRYLTVVADL